MPVISKASTTDYTFLRLCPISRHTNHTYNNDLLEQAHSKLPNTTTVVNKLAKLQSLHWPIVQGSLGAGWAFPRKDHPVHVWFPDLWGNNDPDTNINSVLDDTSGQAPQTSSSFFVPPLRLAVPGVADYQSLSTIVQ